MLFGEVTKRGKVWVIRCEPHVRSRLKRVFARAPQEAGDYVTISDSPENCRELQWFLLRYPMTVKPREKLALQAEAHRKQEKDVVDLLAKRVPPPKADMVEPPRTYQLESMQLLEIKGGLLNADDVGLGKTVTAICSLTLPENLPAVITCPPHLVGHWEKFIKRFLPGLFVYTVKDGKPHGFTRPGGQGELYSDRSPHVVVVSYFRLRTWSDFLAPWARTVIFDECQQLRRADSLIYEACMHMAEKARRRLGLSATPIFNYGSEFFYVVDALLPGALGTRQEFLREWCERGPADKARIADAEEFGAYLRREGIMIRRTRAEVGRELPALSKIIHEVAADSEVLEKMAGDAAHLAKIILAQSERHRGDKMRAAGEFDMIMRQATGIAKAPYVCQFVRMLIENGERVVLFGWHRAVYNIWLEQLKDFNPVLYTGSENPKEKDAAVATFTGGGSQLLIISLRSGAGLDGLQHHVRTAVFGELDWSPGVHEQCVGRVYRDGQKDPVVAYFLVSEDGSDPVMVDVLGIKREQIESVRNPGGPLVERVDTGENNLRQLARSFLERRGVTVEPPNEPEPINA